MSVSNQHSAEKFISRYVALVQDDLLGTTEAGNPQPALLSFAMAYENPRAVQSPAPPSRDFLRDVNCEFAKAGKKLVAFPTNMFDSTDVCVMDSNLFVALLDGTKRDDEAKIVLDHAPSNTLAFVKRLVEREQAHDETTH